MPATRQIGVLPTLGIWAALCFSATLYASWHGAGGRSFAASITAVAWLLLVVLLFAARGFSDRLASRFGTAGYLLVVAAFLAYLIYTVGTISFSPLSAALAALFIFGPVALAASAGKHSPGAWQDFLIIATVWATVKFAPEHWIWGSPGRFTRILTVLLAVNVALAAFLLLRRLDGVGYNLAWGPRWGLFVFASFAAFAVLAILLGQALHFIEFAPRWSEWKSLPALTIFTFLLIAWPEELLFRGLLQNMLSRASKSDLAGWWSASILFGLSHITNGGFPNWRYVVLASIAGFFYGWTWRKTNSIFASAIVHALVDTIWHFLFRTI